MCSGTLRALPNCSCGRDRAFLVLFVFVEVIVLISNRRCVDLIGEMVMI